MASSALVCPCSTDTTSSTPLFLRFHWQKKDQVLFLVATPSRSKRACPLVAIPGVSATPHVLSKTHANVVAFATLLARQRILFNWKSPQPPLVSVWLKDLMFFLKLEKIKFTLRGDTSRFFKHWRPFIQHSHDLVFYSRSTLA